MTKPNYIVGIGASAGGLEALELFFSNVTPRAGIAYMVIQHLSPDFKSMMSEILRRYTALPIYEMENGMSVEADTVYLNIPRHDVTLQNGKLVLTPSAPGSSLARPINLFFESLAKSYGERAIGVILSGSGQDGAKGMAQIDAAQGLTLIQGLETALFSSMPKSALNAVPHAQMLSPREMPDVIIEHVLNPDKALPPSSDDPLLIADENALTYLISLMRRRFEIDFTRYKPHTLFRRLDTRLQITKSANLSSYIRYLQDNVDEQNALYRDLLIDVTAFFRDKEAFHLLEQRVIPDIVGRKEAGETIRLWVAACATGEEAYSLAILFLEEIERQEREVDLKIFATDAHQDSISIASAGIYAKNRLGTMPRERLERYFQPVGPDQNAYEISKEIRKKVVFATHNLLENPHFSQLDMISCRNLLIYFNDEAQEELLSRFHIGLKRGGYLFLGSSEHLRKTALDYEVINATWRLFRKISNQAHPPIGNRSEIVNRLPQHLHKQATLTGNRNWETRLLQKLIPIGFVIDGQGSLKEVYGEGRKLLQFKAGRAALTLTDLLPDSLSIPIRTGLQSAQQKSEMIRFDAVELAEEIAALPSKFVAIQIVPFQGSSIEMGNSGKYYLVSVEPIDIEAHQAGQPPQELERAQPSIQPEDLSKIGSLERELTFTRESLQATIEEMQSANEELQSANEELQSTNEELSSVNEELFTVNAEYQDQNQVISRLNSDIQNMLNASQVMLLFLDRDLVLREVSPAARQVFEFLPSDIGRPISHFNLFKHIKPYQIQAWINRSLDGEYINSIVKTRNDLTLFLQISPYLNQQGELDGALLYCIDFLNPLYADLFSLILPESALFKTLSSNLNVLVFLFDHLQNRVIFHFGNLLSTLGHRPSASDLDVGRYIDLDNWKAGLVETSLQTIENQPIHLLDQTGRPVPCLMSHLPYNQSRGKEREYQGLVIITPAAE